MVVSSVSEQEIDLIFHALSDATRRDIVTRAMSAEHSVTSLARHYAMSFAAVQKHVAVLERAALITKRRRGKEQLVGGDVARLRDATRLIEAWEQLWTARANRIAGILAEDPHLQQKHLQQKGTTS